MTDTYIDDSWLVFKDEKGTSTHRHRDSIVAFGDYSPIEDGLTITFDDGNNKTVDIFLKTNQLDEIYSKLTCRQNAQLIRKGYTAREVRLQHKKALE